MKLKPVLSLKACLGSEWTAFIPTLSFYAFGRRRAQIDGSSTSLKLPPESTQGPWAPVWFGLRWNDRHLQSITQSVGLPPTHPHPRHNDVLDVWSLLFFFLTCLKMNTHTFEVCLDFADRGASTAAAFTASPD